LLVDTGDDRVSVGERVVYQGNLVRNGRNQVWFAPGPVGGGRSDAGGGGGDAGALPRGAKELASGKGDISINAAPNDGTVFICDDSNRVIYSTNIGKGNSFQIFPGQDFVNLNSKKHGSVKLPKGKNYKLYFRER
jgi:hypothetical protein